MHTHEERLVLSTDSIPCLGYDDYYQLFEPQLTITKAALSVLVCSSEADLHSRQSVLLLC
jgi:hypothetical protein